MSVAVIGVSAVLAGRLMVSLGASAAGFVIATAEASRYQMALASMAGVSRAAAVGIGGLTAAARAGSVALGIFGGPLGLAVTLGLTAAAFFAMGGSATSAAHDIDKISQSLNTLNQEQLALRQQQADELMGRLVGEADEAQRALNTVAAEYKALHERMEQGRGVTPQELENVNKTLVELRSELADANQKVDEARNLQNNLAEAARNAAGGVTTLNEALAQTSEAGKKYLERLEDQSIVAGLKTQRQQLDALVQAQKLIFTPEDLKKAQAFADKVDLGAASLRAGSQAAKDHATAMKSLLDISRSSYDTAQSNRQMTERPQPVVVTNLVHSITAIPGH